MRLFHEYPPSYDNPPNLQFGPLSNGPKPLKYTEFYALVGETLAAAWGEEWRARFGPRKPASRDLDLPYIGYSLVRKQPSRDGMGNRWPKLRDEIVDTNNKDHGFETYGQLFDHIIQFDCLHRQPGEADELLLDFEEFMAIYDSYFRSMGVHEIFLQEQLEDDWDDSWKDIAYLRSLQYYVRLDRIILLSTSQLESVATQVNLRLDASS